jgi:hypothetical protein
MRRLLLGLLGLTGMGLVAPNVAVGQITPPTLPRTNYAQTTYNGGVSFGIKVYEYVASTSSNAIVNSSTGAGSFTTQLYGVGIPKPGKPDDVAGDLLATYKTYCVDLYEVIGDIQEVNVSTQSGVLTSVLAGDPGLYPTSTGTQNPVNIDRNLGAAAYIYFAAELQQVASIAALISGYNAVAHATITRQQQIEAAIQLAIWEVTFDGITDPVSVDDAVQKVDATLLVRDINASTSITDNRTYSQGFTNGAFSLNLNSGNANLGLSSVQWGVVQLASQILNAALQPGGTAYQQRSGTYFNFAAPDITPPPLGRHRQDQIFATPGFVPGAAVPEPGTLAMAVVAAGLLGAGLRYRRRQA